MSVKERIKEFIDYKKISQRSFEQESGLSNGYVNNISNSISHKKIEGISKAFPELNTSWLLLGEGQMIRDDSNPASDVKISGDFEKIAVTKRLIEYILKHHDHENGRNASELYRDLLPYIGSLITPSKEPAESPQKTSLMMVLLNHFPELNKEWLFYGVGSPVKFIHQGSTAIGIPGPKEHDNDFDIIVREDGTEFRRLGDERYLMVTPLVEQFAYAGYVSGWADTEYVDELPRHAIVVDKLHFGTYRSFTAKGDSMDNGMKGAIADGDIVTGRKIDKRYWRHKLHLHKFKDYVIHTLEGIIIKRIISHDVETGTIIYESLNPDKETYPNTYLHLNEVVELYNIVAVTEKRG